MLRVGDGEGWSTGQHGGDQQAGVRHAPHHAGADAGGARQVAGGARLVLRQRGQHPAAAPR